MQGFGALFQGDVKANFSSVYPQSSRTKLSWKVGGLYWRMLSCLFVTVLDIYKVWVMVNAVVVFTALYLYTHSCYLSHMCARSLTHSLSPSQSLFPSTKPSSDHNVFLFENEPFVCLVVNHRTEYFRMSQNAAVVFPALGFLCCEWQDSRASRAQWKHHPVPSPQLQSSPELRLGWP